MDAVPVMTAMCMAAQNLKKLATNSGPYVQPRNPANTPTEFERNILAQLENTGVPEIVIREPDKIR